MMTAEQVPQPAMDVEKYLTHQKAQAIARQYGLDPTEESFAKAVGAILCAAAQLAEKEREIDRLQDLFAVTNHDLVVANTRLRQREAELGQVCTIAEKASAYCTICDDWRGDDSDGATSLRRTAFMELAEAVHATREEAGLERRWIAVEERLPDEPQHDVLLWTADDWEGGKNFQQVGVIGEFNRDEWDGKVTHWQPLPPPPKVQP